MEQVSACLYTLAFALIAIGCGLPVVGVSARKIPLVPLERLILSFGIGAILIHLAVFYIGPSALTRTSMGGLAAVAGAAALWGWRGADRSSWGEAVRRLLADRPALLLTWAAVIVGLSGLLQGMAPPNTYDSLMYHLAVPKQDVERGYMAPAWNLAIHHIMFPQMMGDLYRLTLVLVGEKAVQMISGLFALAAAGGAAALVLRMGFCRRSAALAALLFLAVRGVVWQMASAEVDVALAGMVSLALLALIISGRDGDAGLLVLCGALIGGALSIKTNGGPLALGLGLGMSWAAWRGTGVAAKLRFLLIAPMIALLVYAPHLIRMMQWTGNPLFPLANPLFNPDGAAFMQGGEAPPQGLFDFLTDPIAMFVAPTYKFDGMFMGGPLLLMFLPGLLLAGRRLTNPAPVVLVLISYYLFWWKFLNPQVRFLVHVLPAFCSLAAIGTLSLHRSVAGTVWRLPLIAVTAIAVLIQFQFVAVYAALRLPAALGLMSATAYHQNTPTMQGAYYATCRYVAEHLPPGRHYVSLLVPHSYYCPQASAVIDYFPDEKQAWTKRDQPEMTRKKVLDHFSADPPAFVIVATQWENRGNENRSAVFQAVDLDRWRIGRYLASALKGLTPVAHDAYSAVYDGAQVVSALQNQAD